MVEIPPYLFVFRKLFISLLCQNNAGDVRLINYHIYD